MSAESYSPAECLDFDLAVMTWWDQFLGMRQEQKQVPNAPQPRKGYGYGPRYTDAQIIAKLEGTSDVVMDPIVAGMSHDDLMDLMGGWDA